MRLQKINFEPQDVSEWKKLPKTMTKGAPVELLPKNFLSDSDACAPKPVEARIRNDPAPP